MIEFNNNNNSFGFYLDDKPIPIFCPNIGIRLHIDDSNAPDQYIEFTYRPISEQFYNSLMKRPVKLVCPKIPSDFRVSIPIRLDSTGKINILNFSDINFVTFI